MPFFDVKLKNGEIFTLESDTAPTPEQAAEALNHWSAQGYQEAPKPEDSLMTAGRELAMGAIPAAGTAIGGTAGALLGSAAGPAGTVAGDITGGAAGGLLGQQILKSGMGDLDYRRAQAQLEANRQERPFAAEMGGMAPMILETMGGGGPLTKIGREAALAGKAAPLAERLASAATTGARMGGSESAQMSADGQDTNLPSDIARGALTMGVTGFLPHAKSILQAVTGKAVGDAAAMALAGSVYDAAVQGKPMDLSGITDQTGASIPSFMIMNGLTSLFHGHPLMSRAKVDETPIAPEIAAKQEQITQAADKASLAGMPETAAALDQTKTKLEQPVQEAVPITEESKPETPASEQVVQPAVEEPIIDSTAINTKPIVEQPTPKENAPIQDTIQEVVPEERESGNQSREAAETSGSDSLLRPEESAGSTADIPRDDGIPREESQEVQVNEPIPAEIAPDRVEPTPENAEEATAEAPVEPRNEAQRSGEGAVGGGAVETEQERAKREYQEYIDRELRPTWGTKAKFEREELSEKNELRMTDEEMALIREAALKGRTQEAIDKINKKNSNPEGQPFKPAPEGIPSTADLAKKAAAVAKGEEKAEIGDAVKQIVPDNKSSSETVKSNENKSQVTKTEESVKERPIAPTSATPELRTAKEQGLPKFQEDVHKRQIARALGDLKPVHAGEAERYGLKIPEGYKKEGEFLVHSEPETSIAERSPDAIADHLDRFSTKEGVTPTMVRDEVKDIFTKVPKNKHGELLKQLEDTFGRPQGLAKGKKPTAEDFAGLIAKQAERVNRNARPLSLSSGEGSGSKVTDAARKDAVRRLNSSLTGRKIVKGVIFSPDWQRVLSHPELKDRSFTPDDMRAMKSAEGFHDPVSGKTVVITDNVRQKPGETPAQAVFRVIVHERVGHEGAEWMKDNDPAFRKAWHEAVKNIPQEELDALKKRYPGLDSDRLIGEWFAQKAGDLDPNEVPDPKSAFGKIWQAIKDFIARTFGHSTKLDQQVRDLVGVIARHDRALEGRMAEGDVEFSKPAEVIQKVREDLADEWAAFKGEMKSRDAKDKISAGHDVVQNYANYVGAQAKNRMKLAIPDAKDREAMPFVVEAGGDKSKIDDFAAKIAASKDAKLSAKFKPIIERAKSDFDRLDGLRPVHDEMMKQAIKDMVDAGLEPTEVDNYVTRLLDLPESKKDLLPNLLFEMGNGGQGSRYFTKGRSFETLADAIEAGYPPKGTDIADLNQRRVESGQRLIEQKKFIEELKQAKAPTDGKPIIGELEPKETVTYRNKLNDWKANGAHGSPPIPEMAVPHGYTNVQGNIVHNQFAPLLKDLLGQSGLRNTTAGRAALKFAAAAKHGTLVLDTFHVGRVLYKMMIAGGGKPLSMRNGKLEGGFHKGLSALEYGDADLAEAVKQKQITQEEADYAKKMRPEVEGLIRSGLNVGKVSDNLMDQAKLHIPILSGFNDWIFQKLSRGAMLQSALTGLQKNLKNPKYNREQAFRQTAKEMNELFGNLQSQGLFKNKTLQDISRLIFLAPNWTESQFRSEARAYIQAGKAIPDSLKFKQLMLGNVAQTMATGLVAMLAANQVVNYLTKGHSTFENEEDGHKLDAFIPGGKRGYWFNPMEIAGEYAHNAMKYSAKHENAVDIAAHILSNKLSGPARGTMEGVSGRDYSGKPFLNSTDRFRAAIADALPMPILAGAGIEKDPRAPLGYRINRQEGSATKQLLMSSGLKVTNNESPRTQMFALAQPFRPDRGKTDSAGEYTELRRALDQGQRENVIKELKWLTDRGKSVEAIKEAVGIRKSGVIAPELFTGGQAREKEMLKALTPYQRGVYRQAQKDHMANAKLLGRIIRGYKPNQS